MRDGHRMGADRDFDALDAERQPPAVGKAQVPRREFGQFREGRFVQPLSPDGR